jgi:osmotically-inducible protein OsmY
MNPLFPLLLGAAAGAAAAHFLDPDSGSRRRNQLRDQALSKARKGASEATTTATQAANQAKGAAATATPSMPGSDRIKDVDDVTLARKVETEIFRDADAPKGDVSVDVQDGVVHLRGTVADEEWIDRFAKEAGKVDGVQDVRNLLTPA